MPCGWPANACCPAVQFPGEDSLVLAWRGGLWGQDSPLSVSGGLTRQGGGGRQRGQVLAGACQLGRVPGGWGMCGGGRLFQAVASLHAPLPSCPVRATDSLIFLFYNDSFENLISKGNCLNTHHDCERRPL